MERLTLRLDALKAGLPEGNSAEAQVLIRVQAPVPPSDHSHERLPLRLALVLDKSGSMRGRPLQEAKACAQAIIRRLSASDQVAVIAYDNDAEVVIPCQQVENSQILCEAVDLIRSGGGTNLHAGWLAGINALAAGRHAGGLSQVLLLSDGLANQGLKTPNALAKECTKAASLGIGTSTYGLGHTFDETLMTEMANHGRGRAYYGETAEDLMGVFEEEFAFLSDLYARELKLSLRPKAGNVVDLQNPYPLCGVLEWSLPNLPWAAEAWAVARVRVDQEKAETGLGGIGLLDASLSYLDQQGAVVDLDPVTLALPVLPEAVFGSLPEEPQVALRIRDLKIATIQGLLHQAALAGDWDEVRRQLDLLHELSGGEGRYGQILENLEAMARTRRSNSLSKEAHFRSTQAPTLPVPLSTLPPDPNRVTPSYLREKTSMGKRDKDADLNPPRKDSPHG